MNFKKAEIPFIVLAALIVAGIVVMVLLDKPVPTFLYLILSAILAGGLGIATPSTSASELPPELAALANDVRSFFASELAPAPTTQTPPGALASVPPPAPAAVPHTGGPS